MRTSAWRILSLTCVVVLLAAPTALAADPELQRDDGKREGKHSSSGTGHAITFDAPKGRWWLRSVKIHGQRYGQGYDAKKETFRVSVCDENLVPISHVDVPYVNFPPGRWKWVEVQLPRFVLVPRRFSVVAAFDPTKSKGVFVGWAKTAVTHSAFALPGGKPERLDGKEWMIRASLVKKPPRGSVKMQVVAYDSGIKAGQQSLQNSGHVMDVKRPSGKWWIESVLLYGKRYGGNYDPRRTDFRVAITDRKMVALQKTTARYGLFKTDWHWLEVPLEEPIEAPTRFRVAVDFDPSRTKGVYMGFTKAQKTHSFTGKVDRRATPWGDGEWMIRVKLASEKPEPPPPEALAHDPEVYKEDFEFLKKTVKEKFPALEKKGVDWDAVCAEFEPIFATCPNDEQHVLNARRLLARLGDMHTGVTRSDAEPHIPAFDGLFGAGMWIAREGDHLVMRALMDGHPHEKKLGPGAVLVAVDGVPARIVHERVRRRLKEWHGWSSDHFLDARLSFQFFPFGNKKTIRARFLNPDGEIADVDLVKWGPGGKGLRRADVTMPSGVDAEGLVVTSKLAIDVGYIRILGGMNEKTREAFFAGLSKIKGVSAIVLDCRGMGGGGDGPAWAMAGRFFTQSIPLRNDPVLKPSGDWQFDGPLVMLQDDRMVSSAETFTWALSETKRAVTVGRPTGGATIIPRTFAVPSEIFHFRLGVRDRETSTYGVYPEGIGTPPDVHVCHDAALLTRLHDPVLAAGFDIARLMLKGASRSTVVDTYGGVLGVEPTRLIRALPEWRGTVKPDGLLYDDLTGKLVDAIVWWGIERARNDGNLMPDVMGQGRSLDRLAAMAQVCERPKWAKKAREEAAKLDKERRAQVGFDRMIAEEWPPSAEALDRYVKEHEGTRWANAVAHAFD